MGRLVKKLAAVDLNALWMTCSSRAHVFDSLLIFSSLFLSNIDSPLRTWLRDTLLLQASPSFGVDQRTSHLCSYIVIHDDVWPLNFLGTTRYITDIEIDSDGQVRHTLRKCTVFCDIIWSSAFQSKIDSVLNLNSSDYCLVRKNWNSISLHTWAQEAKKLIGRIMTQL